MQSVIHKDSTLEPNFFLQVNVKSFGFSWNGKYQMLFENLQFKVPEGHCLAIMGPSGSGKSTLLKILMGFEKSANGFVEYRQKNFSFQDSEGLGNLFSLVPQTPMLLPWKTVFQNLALVHKGNHTQSEILSLLELVGLQNSAQKYPWQLSQGMAARVSFARSLLINAPILLLDEPFAALDAYKKEELGEWLVNLRSTTKKTMILVTHDKHEALAVANDTFLLS
jgi:ABC-type nitrate/sulfonate/bicarbonate transport system ATPase subunit